MRFELRKPVRLCLPLMLAGCTSVQTLGIDDIAKVQQDLKRQVGIYVAVVSKQRPPQPALGQLSPPVDAQHYWCPTKIPVDFDISSIKLDLTTTQEDTNSATLGATVPTPDVKVGVNLGKADDTTTTQEMTFTEYVPPANIQPDEIKSMKVDDRTLQSAPIAVALLNLRKSLIAANLRSGTPQPCFTDTLPKMGAQTLIDGVTTSDTSNAFKLGITYVSTGTAGLTLTLGPLVLGDSFTNKNTFANSLTVSFAQLGANPLEQLIVRCPDQAKDGFYCANDTKKTPITAFNVHPDVMNTLGPLLKGLGLGASDPNTDPFPPMK